MSGLNRFVCGGRIRTRNRVVNTLLICLYRGEAGLNNTHGMGNSSPSLMLRIVAVKVNSIPNGSS